MSAIDTYPSVQNGNYYTSPESFDSSERERRGWSRLLNRRAGVVALVAAGGLLLGACGDNEKTVENRGAVASAEATPTMSLEQAQTQFENRIDGVGEELSSTRIDGSNLSNQEVVETIVGEVAKLSMAGTDPESFRAWYQTVDIGAGSEGVLNALDAGQHVAETLATEHYGKKGFFKEGLATDGIDETAAILEKLNAANVSCAYSTQASGGKYTFNLILKEMSKPFEYNGVTSARFKVEPSAEGCTLQGEGNEKALNAFKHSSGLDAGNGFVRFSRKDDGSIVLEGLALPFAGTQSMEPYEPKLS